MACSIIKYIIYQVAAIGMAGAEGRASMDTGTERTQSDRGSWLCWSQRSMQYSLGVCQRLNTACFSYYELVLNNVSSYQKDGTGDLSYRSNQYFIFSYAYLRAQFFFFLKCNPSRIELCSATVALESSVCPWEWAQAMGLVSVWVPGLPHSSCMHTFGRVT